MFAYLVYLTGQLSSSGGSLPMWFYSLLVLVFVISQIASNCTYTSIMAFNAKISDPEIGGTYMTMLNTVTNFGGNLPQTSAIWFVDRLSSFDCIGHNSTTEIDWNNKNQKEVCVEHGGELVTIEDGYYKEIIFCTVFGIIWLKLMWKTLQKFDLDSIKSWHVSKNAQVYTPLSDTIQEPDSVASRVTRRRALKKAD